MLDLVVGDRVNYCDVVNGEPFDLNGTVNCIVHRENCDSIWIVNYDIGTTGIFNTKDLKYLYKITN